jgi:hypothetical protein
VYLYYNDLFQYELTIIRKNEYDVSSGIGNPKSVYITSGARPYLYPTPIPNEVGFSIQLRGQRFPKNILSEEGKITHDFPQAWQLYLVLRLAYMIGNGPVVRLPSNTLSMFKRDAQELEDRLIGSRAGQEQTKTNRTVKVRAF